MGVMRKVHIVMGYFADEDISWIIAHGRRKNIGAAEELIKAGRRITEIYILIAGELSVRHGQAEEQEVSRRYPGDIVGELTYLDNRAPIETVIAVAATTLVAIDRSILADHLEEDPAFAARFFRALGVMLASRFRQSMGQLTLRQEYDALDKSSADELDSAFDCGFQCKATGTLLGG